MFWILISRSFLIFGQVEGVLYFGSCFRYMPFQDKLTSILLLFSFFNCAVPLLVVLLQRVNTNTIHSVVL